MRCRIPLLLVVATAALAAESFAALPALASGPAWTTYRHDAARSGIDPDSTTPLTPTQTWRTPALDGEVYAQPLVYGSSVYVATENDTIYALDAATGGVLWSTHLATPEPSSAAPCGDIAPSIGITSTPVLDPATNRIYAVGAVTASGTIRHELFALDLSSGQQVAGFPIAVDPPYPPGGAAVNQLQRPGLALDAGRILIGYGGNDGDCSTYWGWLVSAPTDGTSGLGSFQVDPGHRAGAIWAAGNAPTIDAAGNVFVATGNGIGNTTADPQYGDAVVKLSASATALDWWAPTNWQSLDSTDADLGSSMPTLLPGGYLFQSGKDGNGYVLNGAGLGHVSSAPVTVTGFCPGGSFGGSVYDSANSTIYVACSGGLRALSVGSGSPPSLSAKAGFSAPSGSRGPPMIAGGLVWSMNYSSGTLYGLDPASGATRSQFAIPETGTQVNHFASPSAGGGRLFVGSGNQVTAYTIAEPPPATSTTTTLVASPNPAPAGAAVSLTATVSPTPDRGTVTFTDSGAPIAGCSGVAVSTATSGRASCRASFSKLGKHNLSAAYSGDGFYAASTSGALAESITAPALSGLRLSSHRLSIAGRRVGGRCVKPNGRNDAHRYCRRPLRLKVTFALDAAATVRLTVKRKTSGRKVDGRCVKATPKNAGRRRCARFVLIRGAIIFTSKAGGNAFTFAARIGRQRLGPGAYQLIATPIAAGQAGTRRRVTFVIMG